MIARTTAARAAASIILVGSLLVGTAGCTFITPQSTLQQYTPSDGVGVDVGAVQVRNTIALVSDDGKSVSLLITIVNSGDRSAEVNLQFFSDGEKTTVASSVKGGGTASFGNTVDEKQIIIREPGVTAGELLPVYVQYGDNEGKQMLVPVLNADNHPEYKPLLPPDATP